MIRISDYQKMYTLMFNAATDALRAMEKLNLGDARELLICAQQQAEEIYLSGGEGEEIC